jgi:glycosyltransferase involved in cell wall biosynthesis
MAETARAATLPRQKVSFVIDKLAGRSGGAERVLIETANALAARGHQVEILSHESRGAAPFYPLALGVIHTNLRRPAAARGRLRRKLDAQREGLHHRVSSFPFPADHLMWQSKHGAFWRRLERHLDLHRPDVAIAFLPPAITALGLCRPRYPLRRVASLHNVPQHDLQNPARWDPNPLDRKRRMAALEAHDAITVLLPEFRDWFDEPLRAKISIVPNKVQPVSQARRDRAVRQKTVLSVGRLAPVKRHGLLVEAWGKIAADFPDWQVKIFGTGPLRKELAARIREAGLEDQVLLMGHTDAIDKEYLSASLLCHPAEYEGWGLAVTEAMAAGVPAIGFADCPGVNQLIDDGQNGLLVSEAGDAAENLAQALASLMGDDARREALGENGPDSVRDYAPEKVIDRWEDILHTGKAAS